MSFNRVHGVGLGKLEPGPEQRIPISWQTNEVILEVGFCQREVPTFNLQELKSKFKDATNPLTISAPKNLEWEPKLSQRKTHEKKWPLGESMIITGSSFRTRGSRTATATKRVLKDRL